MKFKKKFRISSFENREVELELPTYRRYMTGDSMCYVKFYQNTDGQMAETTIAIADNGDEFNIEFENPHKFGYGYNFYMGHEDSDIIDESEFTRVVGQIISNMLKVLGVLNES